MNETLHSLALAGKLAQNADAAKTVPIGDYVAEPKYDGWRLLAFVNHDSVTMFARSGKAPPGKLPAIEADLLERFPAGSVIDGEAVALSVENGRVFNNWGTAQSALTTHGANPHAAKITYMVFDLIAHRGLDARPLGLWQRRELLERIFAADDASRPVQLTVQFTASNTAYEAMVAQGFEGMMVKSRTAKYASGKRGHGWIKMKAQDTADVIVMGFKPGKGDITGLIGSIVFGQYEDGVLVERGACSGMDMRTRIAITKNQEKWLGRTIEIGYLGLLGGNYRSPQFKRVRDDKNPMEVTTDAA